MESFVKSIHTPSGKSEELDLKAIRAHLGSLSNDNEECRWRCLRSKDLASNGAVRLPFEGCRIGLDALAASMRLDVRRRIRRR